MRGDRGMDGGRLLASHSESLDVAYCTPASSGTAVACLGFPNEQADPDIVVADLYAGAADGESEPLLAPIDHVIAATRADSGGVHRFNFDFPASGTVAWSGRLTPDGPEILKLASVADPASAITVASDVHEWTISPDGSAWLWLSAVDDQGTGMLQTALFPDGSYPKDLVAVTYDYAINRNGSLAAVTTDGSVISVVDPIGAPAEQRQLDNGVVALVALSDEDQVAYAKNLVGTRFGDLFVAKLDDSRTCTLDTKADVPLNSVHFSPGAETALWAHANADHYDAFHSRLADCSTVTLASDITVLGWMGSGNAVFMDSVDSATLVRLAEVPQRRQERRGSSRATDARRRARRLPRELGPGPAALHRQRRHGRRRRVRAGVRDVDRRGDPPKYPGFWPPVAIVVQDRGQ